MLLSGVLSQELDTLGLYWMRQLLLSFVVWIENKQLIVFELWLYMILANLSVAPI